MEKKIKFGILGYGNMGTEHSLNLSKGLCPDLELVAIADLNPDRRAAAKELWGDKITIFNSGEEMLESGMLEACLIAVPHYDHPRFVIDCLKRGIHVMSEKPAGVYAKAVREMNEEADKHPDVVFGMMFNLRAHRLSMKLRELVHSGKYGEIRRVNWMITDWFRTQLYYDSGNWRATWAGEGGGVLVNQCPHQLDLLQWVCGMPVKVHSHIHFGKWHDIEVEDDVTAYLEWENGATGVFVTSTGDGCGTDRLEIQMDRAKIVLEGSDLSLIEFEESATDFIKNATAGFGRIKTEKVELENNYVSTHHVGVLNAFAGAILRGEPLIADGREGINGVRLANAIHLSGFLGKTVDCPVDEDLYYEELMKRVATSRRKTEVKTVFMDTNGSRKS